MCNWTDTIGVSDANHVIRKWLAGFGLQISTAFHWRSTLHGVQKVAGSNPVTPTLSTFELL
jgi:hypothetical protein